MGDDGWISCLVWISEITIRISDRFAFPFPFLLFSFPPWNPPKSSWFVRTAGATDLGHGAVGPGCIRAHSSAILLQIQSSRERERERRRSEGHGHLSPVTWTLLGALLLSLLHRPDHPRPCPRHAWRRCAWYDDDGRVAADPSMDRSASGRGGGGGGSSQLLPRSI